MESKRLLYLSQKDIEKIGLSMLDIVTSLESMFREKGKGRVEMPPKPGIHPGPDAFIHAMPAYIPGLKAAGMKWVAGFPDNPKSGLPYISGLIVLNDPDTGLPLAVMDCIWITAKRTGAATAVAAKYLARTNSSTVGILGCGVQGRSNLEALACVFNIDEVKAFDINSENAERYRQEMEAQLGLNIQIVDSVFTAVHDSDIVVSCGPILKKPKPSIAADWLSPGGFACAIDFDSYWKGDALRQADKLATDDIPQLDFYRQVGYFQDTPQPYADLGEIVAGIKPGRETEQERTISMNLGLALDDMATAILLYNKALEMDIGTFLPL